MNDMTQLIFNVGLAVIGVMAGWLFNIIFNELKVLRSQVDKINSDISDKYVRRDDLKDLSNAIFKKLDKIEDKLDGKVDRI